MVFVDGENLTIRAQALATSRGDFSLTPGAFYLQDVFVWLPPSTESVEKPADLLIWRDSYVEGPPLRSTYYTSLVGDEDCIQRVRTDLWNLGFHPEVFKKSLKTQKAKGVDISLTKDMLSHAFLGNYDIAILIAGDGDYIPLVQEIERLGKRLHVCFFDDQSLNPGLKLAADHFINLSDLFVWAWKRP
jgi:hypothetical protein